MFFPPHLFRNDKEDRISAINIETERPKAPLCPRTLIDLAHGTIVTDTKEGISTAKVEISPSDSPIIHLAVYSANISSMPIFVDVEEQIPETNIEAEWSNS